MTTRSLGFNEVSKASKFRKFCHLLCETTGVYLVFASPSVKLRDMLYYRRENGSLCEHLRRDPAFRLRCDECDRLRCGEAVLRRKGFHYECHAGLVDIAVPVFIDGSHVGTFMGGQLLPKFPDAESFKAFASKLKGFSFDRKELRRLFLANPWMEDAKVRNIVELVSIFAGHFQELGSRLVEERKAASPVELACERIQRRLKEPLSLSELSRSLGLSAPYFSALFKKSIGEGYLEYVRRLRVEHAKRLLEDSPYAISRVASESGFSSIASFNRCFRQLAGTSPSAYRAKLRS